MNPEELLKIRDLFAHGVGIRALARRFGRDPKTIRRALGRTAPDPVSPRLKLKPFEKQVIEKCREGLTAKRILREIRKAGYSGGLTILKNFIQTLGLKPPRRKKVHRRFETAMGVEMQCDWSPYRVPIAGTETPVHCFSMLLCASRRLFVAFYRNERLPTLLWAHVEAFTYLGGLCARIVYDNQTAVTLGRIRGKPIWNPTFEQFANHYGFKPFAHRPKHKERSGKVERPFRYVESDFIKASRFESWEDLNRRARIWLDTVANVRKHATTGRFVNEAYEEEKPFLIALPQIPYHAERREVRKVLTDGTVSVDGSFYPVPAHLVGQHVSVRIYPHHVEVADAAGRVAVRHAIPDHPMRLPADWGPPRPQETSLSRTVLETRFLARFPQAEEFLEGLKRRMNALASVHLRRIERLVTLYGDVPVAGAIERATRYRNFNAKAVERILEAKHPDVFPEAPVQPLLGNPAVLGALDDIDSGSLSEYTFEAMPPTEAAPEPDEGISDEPEPQT
jgi:transposase